MLDGAFVLVDETGVRTDIPVGGLVCLMLEPGTRVSHAAVALAARAGTLLIWVGEAGVRLYAAGQPGGARADRLLLSGAARARRRRCGCAWCARCMRCALARRRRSAARSISCVASRARACAKSIKLLAQRHGVEWTGGNYDPQEWSAADVVNRCLSAATSALYGVTEAAVLAAGYAPAIGFLHTGKPQSFVYDIADLSQVRNRGAGGVPGGRGGQQGKPLDGRPVIDPVGEVRRRCRDAFRRTNILARLIPTIEEVLAAGGLTLPEPPPEAMPVAFEGPTEMGDAGHRG